MDRKQRIQSLLDRLDVLEGRSTKKTRIQGLLARLDKLTKEKEDRKGRTAEIDKTIAKNSQVRGLFARLQAAKEENEANLSSASQDFLAETSTIRQEILKNRDEDRKLTEAELNALSDRLTELEAALYEKESEFNTKDSLLESELSGLRQQLAALPDFSGFAPQASIQSLERSIDDLEKRIIGRLSTIQRGGGNANRQIVVNGSASTLSHYTDINFLPGSNMGIAVTTDHTAKRTNFVLSAEGGGTISSVVSGTGIFVDNTNPNTPIVNLGTASVTAGTYGSATTIPRFTVDAQGRLSAASNVGLAVSPGGATTNVQYNDGGVFGGDANLTWDKNNQEFRVTGPVYGNQFRINDNGGFTNNVSGATINMDNLGGFNIIPSATKNLQFVDPNSGLAAALSISSIAADRTYSFPDKSGTFAVTSDIVLSSVVAGGGIVVSANAAAPVIERSSIVGDISIPQGSVIATLPNVNANVGTFGDSTTVPRVTVNAKGQVTAASNVGITFPTVPAGVTSVLAGGGIVVGNANPATPIVERGSIVGDVSIPQGSVTATLAAVASNVGTFGTSTTVAQVQIDNKGRVVLASTVGIAFPAATTPAGANTQIQFNDGGAFGASSTFTWNMNTSVLTVGNSTNPSVLSVKGPSSTLTFDGNVGIGTTAAPATALDVVFANNTGLRLTDNTSNSTIKDSFLQGRHFTNAEEDVMLLWSASRSSENALNFGGGSTLFNTATDIHFYTAANTTTTTGTERMTVTSSGNVGIGITAPTSNLHSGGSLAVPINTQSSVYTLNASDHTLLCNASVAGFTVNLPNASSITGRIYVIKKTDVTANAVTIDGAGAQTIDGAATVAITTQWEAVAIQSNTTGWVVI